MRNAHKSRLSILLSAVLLISLGIIYINGTLANLTDYERNNLGPQSRTDANKHYNVSIVDCKNPEDSIMSRTDLFSNIKWCRDVQKF